MGDIDECEHVFIDGNNLKNRFRDLSPNSNFSIGEIGFGIGLNFLITCKAWLKYTEHNQVLEFYSFDKYIFALEDFNEFISSSSELKEYSEQLIKYYPKNIEGIQKISLFDGRISLNLIIGDISDTQEYIKSMTYIDAWFLDGFSPSKNPDLWSKELINSIGNTSYESSTISTYTSSGLVKRNLIDSGFAVRRTKGFAGKRHMLKGDALSKVSSKQGYSKKVAVIGSGITGCILSYLLAQKGIEVDLYEQSDSICAGASSHELLVTYPRLSAHDSAYGRFNLLSYVYATNFYENLKTQSWKKTGVLILNHDEDTARRQKALLERRSDGKIYRHLNYAEASELSGIEVKYDGLHFKDAGYVLPNELCGFLTGSEKINVFTNSKIENLSGDGMKTTFTIRDEHFEYDDVCLCTGSDSSELMNIDGFSTKRGQVSHLESIGKISRINLPICAKGYISPEVSNLHIVGSSYSDYKHTDLIQEEHLSNLKKLQTILDEDVKVKSGKVGLRAISKDHMPMVGKKDGIFLNTCHGSRASVSAPICAEIISNLITEDAPPLQSRELKALCPLRFN